MEISFGFLARTVVVLLAPFFIFLEKMDFSRYNAIFTSGLMAICAHVICLSKEMKIKLKNLMEINSRILVPDEIEMSVFNYCFKLHMTETLETVS